MEKIRLELSDWLYNAGLVGFINILKYAGDEFEYDMQGVSFQDNVLENFEDKYFNYFVNTYEGVMTYTKLYNKINYLLSIDIENEITEEQMKVINDENIKYIKDKMKNTAYKDRVLGINMDALNNIIKENLSINTSVLKELKAVLDSDKYQIIKSECIGYYDQKSKGSKSPNAIIDKYINTNMLEINRSIQEIRDYFKESKSNFKFKCFSCGREISNIDKGLSFLNRMYFDTSRKTSHVWNFTSDIEYCPICKLIYYCIPAGFTTVYGRGIYINENQNIEDAVKINNKIKTEILNDKEMNQNTIFKAIIVAMQETINENAKYDLSDIQVIRYENNEGNEKYRFNILSKQLLTVINNSREDLDKLISAGYNEINTYFRIYEEVMRKLFNNENLFQLIHKALVTKITKPSDARFNMGHIRSLININLQYLKGVGCMENVIKDMLSSYRGAGYYLKQAYIEKNSENKLNGISYKLLNSLKTNNKGMFMDTLLNCYLYTGKQVPSFFTDCLKDNETFKTIGYAFVSGLIEGEGKNSEKINGGKVE